jgi:hypothetical protein
VLSKLCRFDHEGEGDIVIPKYFLMICWMRPGLKHENESVLPYPVYKYNIGLNAQRKSCLLTDIVPIESVIRPACLIIHAQHHEKWSDVNKVDIKRLRDHMFYCLPYSIITRDYCDGFVEFLSKFKHAEYHQERQVSSSSSSSSRDMESTIFKNGMNMEFILDPMQIAEIDNFDVDPIISDQEVESDDDHDDDEKK